MKKSVISSLAILLTVGCAVVASAASNDGLSGNGSALSVFQNAFDNGESDVQSILSASLKSNPEQAPELIGAAARVAPNEVEATVNTSVENGVPLPVVLRALIDAGTAPGDSLALVLFAVTPEDDIATLVATALQAADPTENLAIVETALATLNETTPDALGLVASGMADSGIPFGDTPVDEDLALALLDTLGLGQEDTFAQGAGAEASTGDDVLLIEEGNTSAN